MKFSSPAEGFPLAYGHAGSDSPVMLLHGWPGDRTDYQELVPRLSDFAAVIVPDLCGLGHSEKHIVEPESAHGDLAP
jgi:pimeloyl-ACP methyl ester carboxylesterase